MIWTTLHVVLAFYVGGWVAGTMHCYDALTRPSPDPDLEGERGWFSLLICAFVGIAWPVSVGSGLVSIARRRA